MFLRAVTPLHAGIGRAGGVVDLPVQRDLYGYPVIYASSLKGALKSTCMKVNQGNKSICKELFGSLPGEIPTQPGKVAVLDVQPLLIPVRLLRGVYGYITSPLLLKRFVDYAEIIEASSRELGELVEEIEIESSRVLVKSYDSISIKSRIKNGDREKDYIVVNEEYWLEPETSRVDLIDKLVGYLPGQLQQDLGLRGGGQREDLSRLLVVSDSDDVSLQIVEKSLLRLQRIRLKEDVKVVDEGALWSEEYVPRNTVFYTLILYSNTSSSQRFREYLGRTGGYLILGGDETIGRGLVKLYFMERAQR